MRPRLSFLRWNAVPETRKAALANCIVRILVAPLSIAIELAHLHERIIEDEPELGIFTGDCSSTQSSSELLRDQGEHRASLGPILSCWTKRSPCRGLRSNRGYPFQKQPSGLCQRTSQTRVTQNTMVVQKSLPPVLGGFCHSAYTDASVYRCIGACSCLWPSARFSAIQERHRAPSCDLDR